MSGEAGGDWGVASESLTRGTGRARGSAFEAALTRWTFGLNEKSSRRLTRTRARTSWAATYQPVLALTKASSGSQHRVDSAQKTPGTARWLFWGWCALILEAVAAERGPLVHTYIDGKWLELSNGTSLAARGA
ncbi:hypothetical protein HPB50_001799 [Hyalomma asiaticum]|uniref:Uncharacterized protein n=1 Tax=Hyalomma asiaticum TaxID=266040 RepID=A0ACB7SE03_HYAAI|nr:hypothetical protein HPB50_001799 [Hyalomma asiaticum]